MIGDIGQHNTPGIAGEYARPGTEESSLTRRVLAVAAPEPVHRRFPHDGPVYRQVPVVERSLDRTDLGQRARRAVAAYQAVDQVARRAYVSVLLGVDEFV